MCRLCAFCTIAVAAVPVWAGPPIIELHPPSLDLAGPGDRHSVLVTVIQGGRRRDATREATFVAEQARVCTTTKSGEVHAAAYGETVVTVTVAGVVAELPVTVANGSASEPPSFVNHVIPLLTRLGCNQATCHAAPEGRNGFRLSIHGEAPELDHRWLTRALGARRAIGLGTDESLLLRKATGRTTHEGGSLVRPNGYEYALLRSWLEAGAPGPKAGEVVARRIELFPEARSLRVGESQQLLARAEFAPGIWRDVTWLTRFDSTDPNVATVTAGGRVTAVRRGKATIRAAYQARTVEFAVTVPPQAPPPMPR